jgi:hypothetical protein
VERLFLRSNRRSGTKEPKSLVSEIFIPFRFGNVKGDSDRGSRFFDPDDRDEDRDCRRMGQNRGKTAVIESIRLMDSITAIPSLQVACVGDWPKRPSRSSF